MAGALGAWYHVSNLPCRCCCQSGKPHGASCVVAQSIRYKWLPPLGQLHICWEQKWKPIRMKMSVLPIYTVFNTNSLVLVRRVMHICSCVICIWQMFNTTLSLVTSKYTIDGHWSSLTGKGHSQSIYLGRTLRWYTLINTYVCNWTGPWTHLPSTGRNRAGPFFSQEAQVLWCLQWNAAYVLNTRWLDKLGKKAGTH